MNCPQCGGKSPIADTKKAGKDQVERRRRCQNCGLVFETLSEERLVAQGVKPFIRTSARYRDVGVGKERGTRYG